MFLPSNESLKIKSFEDLQIVFMLENLTDGYMTFDEQWRFRFVSPKCQKLLQLPDQLEGKSLWENFSLLRHTEFYSASQQAVAARQTKIIEEQCPYTHIWIESIIQPCNNGVVIYYRDITQRVKARAEQARFVSILEASPDFVCIHDTQYKQIYVNKAGRQMLQFGAEENLANVTFHPRWATDLILTKGIPTAIRDGVWVGETALLRRDGREIPISQVIIAHRDDNDEVEFISTIGRDITDRKQTENQLREHAALLDQSPDAIIVCNQKLQIAYWNKGAERIYGWKPEEAIGKNILKLIKIDRALGRFAAVKESLFMRGEWHGEGRAFTKDDRKVNTYSHWTVLRDASGNFNSILIIHTDITEQKKLEEQFLRSQRLESIGTLANGIAHDLNNVLSPILLATRILSLKLKDEDSQQLLGTLRRSAERGADLVRQVLSYVRGAEGERTYFQPNQSISEAVRILRETLPKNIQFELEIAPDLHGILGDRTQIYQVLMNLCLNARDAMPVGGILRLRAQNYTCSKLEPPFPRGLEFGSYVWLSVSDNGTGIPLEIKNKIFDPFFTTKAHGQGSGLGLATVQSIIKSHHGVIEVESEIGQGTTFHIYLPALSAPVALEQKRETPEFVRGKGETILVVDDESDILQLTSETLAAHGYNPLIANGGEAALQKMKQNGAPLDLVLVDMMMPGLDGIATIRELKKMHPTLKFITTSGLADPAKISEANELGALAFLPKPCAPGELIQTIAAALNHQSSVTN